MQTNAKTKPVGFNLITFVDASNADEIITNYITHHPYAFYDMVQAKCCMLYVCESFQLVRMKYVHENCR